MSSSLVKYATRDKAQDGRNLYWARVEEDGLPYRGKHAPVMPDEEYEARTRRVADFRNAFFAVEDQGQNKQFLDVMECIANGWFYLAHIERFWQGKPVHYVEWIEYYMEDGSRTSAPSTTYGSMEVAGGTPAPA